MGGGGGGPGYFAEWYPTRGVRDRNSDVGFVRQSLNLGAPIYRDGANTVLLTASVKNVLFDTDAVLPDTGRAFPNALWSVSFGVLTTRKFENGWTGGLMLNTGSSSDKPFANVRDMNLGGMGFLRVPVRDGRDAWQFSVMYSSAGNLSFPIPGVAYSWNPSDRFRMSIGLPFSIHWQPFEEWSLDASYVPLTNGRVRVTYKPVERVKLYAGYESTADSYFLADRVETRDRFLMMEQRLITGLTWQFHDHGTLDVFGGYAFDRRLGEGQNQGGDLHDRVNLRPGPFAGLRLGLKF